MTVTKVTILGIALAITGLTVWFSCSSDTTARQPVSHEEMIKRGEYLVATIGCTNCHTPKVMTPEGPKSNDAMFLAGHPQDASIPADPFPFPNSDEWSGIFSTEGAAWAGPWGISFATNLTPDTLTGIGAWNEEVFIGAMRTGEHMGGSRVTRPSFTVSQSDSVHADKHAGVKRQILPPMPWESYSKLSDEDLKSIFAYLKSLKPVENMVPAPVPPADE